MVVVGCSYFWGVVADKKGRKPVIVWSGILTSIFVLAFGFSVNLPMAAITRFLVGFFNGKCCNNDVVGRAKRAPHWAAQLRFRVIYVSLSKKNIMYCMPKCMGGITWPNTCMLRVLARKKLKRGWFEIKGYLWVF